MIMIFVVSIAAACYYYYVVPQPARLHVLYTSSDLMVNEVVNDFKEWYGSPIEITLTPTDYQSAYETVTNPYRKPEAEIWWGAPLLLFEKASGSLLPYNVTHKNEMETAVHSCPLMDLDQNTPRWYAASLYALGLVYNEQILDALDLTKPETWADLLKAECEENITMVDPAQSEFTQPFIMLIIQSQNWTKAWEYLVRVSAFIKNYDDTEVTSVLKVESGYLPMAIVPDFYAYDRIQQLEQIGVHSLNFTYLDATVLQPDPIAIIRWGEHLEEAKAFMNYILSQQAQTIIGKYRLPIQNVMTSPPRINPFDSNFPYVPNYNKTFEEIGKEIVKDYYKVWMTENHVQLREVWAKIKEANETSVWKNFTYPGYYMMRSQVDTLYEQTNGWTENVSSYIAEWQLVRDETLLGSVIRVLLRTDMGDITIQLFDDMPITTGNFKKLVQEGVYDGTIFHRVIDGFMIQGGDPTGTGSGDPTIPTIPDEFTDHNRNDRGTIAMANAGPNTGSSQFFINLVDNNYLDSQHPVFGKVIEGMDVVDNIAKVETDENYRPLQEIKLIKAEIIS